jgi:hypothetical protein
MNGPKFADFSEYLTFRLRNGSLDIILIFLVLQGVLTGRIRKVLLSLKQLDYSLLYHHASGRAA